MTDNELLTGRHNAVSVLLQYHSNFMGKTRISAIPIMYWSSFA